MPSNQDQSGLLVREMLGSSAVQIRTIECDGSCRHRSAVECAASTHLVYPYRGAFFRHVGRKDSLGDANSLVIFNAGQEYQISHPLAGGDECLSIAIDPALLAELCHPANFADQHSGVFNAQSRKIDSKAQTLAALLVHRMGLDALGPLEAEILALNLAQRSFGEPRSGSRATFGRTKLVERAKLVLLGDIGRRWTLGEVAAEIGISPVYLAQVFSQVEEVPLYRYHLQLRLSRALALVPVSDNFTGLALELGFSSHSHFTSAFRQHYGISPSQFRKEARSRPVTFDCRNSTFSHGPWSASGTEDGCRSRRNNNNRGSKT